MDLLKLKQFLIDSNNAGYAGGEEKKWIKEDDGSTTIPFEKGEWRSHDNFFGGKPYGGKTIVFYQNKPYWIMVYYGWVEEGVETNPVYGILRNALKQMPIDYPFRGPKEYKEDEFIYTNNWQGKVDRFSGEERILQGDKLIYKANYMGGLVDQRKGV
jgi:hypothetical protein